MKNLDNKILRNCAKIHGTPLYVYNLKKIELQYEKISSIFDYDNVSIHYAMKALSNPHILKVLLNLGCQIDAVSIYEIKLAKSVGFKSSQIIFTPSFCSEIELEEAILEGVNINLDNVEILEYLGQNHPGYKVGLRFNPKIMGGGNSNISVGHIDSKFGIHKEDIPDVLSICNKYNLVINGIHVHVGSDINNFDAFEKTIDFMINLGDTFQDIEYIDFGSGFKVPYRKNDEETNLEMYGDIISKKMKVLSNKRNKSIKIIIEPGKYLVSSSGSFIVEVNGVKESIEKTFVGVNSGLNHLIRPMFYDSFHFIHNISRDENETFPYDIVGYICENDTFGKDRLLSKTTKGDFLSIENAGAYCFSMASNYNSRPLPAEVMVNGEEITLIRKSQDFNSLIKDLV